MDEPVGPTLAQYPQWGVLSARHLLAMQSGLVNTYLDVDGGVREDLAHGYLDVELTPEGWEPAVGSPLKLYGSVALATSDDAIEEYLAPLGVPRCFCFDEAGELALCDE